HNLVVGGGSGDAVHLRKAGRCLLLSSTVGGVRRRATQGGVALLRTIRTNTVVGGLAAAVLGLGFAIGAGHAPADAAPIAPISAIAPAAPAVTVAAAAAKPEAAKTEAAK